MARILVSGIATRDIVNYVDHYPAEDEKMRASVQDIRLGGNAANTAVVLAQFGHKTDFLGTISTDTTGDSLIREINATGVMTTYCPRVAGSTPTSYITLNRQNGSRTIVHYRDLEEVSADDFPLNELPDYDWIHFEGRNVSITREILAAIRSCHSHITISLEIEQSREGIEDLYDYADVLLFSSAYARSRGFKSAQEFLLSVQYRSSNHLTVCSWGESGAVALNQDGQLFSAPAWKPARVIDTVAAGDTFNAGIIHAMNTRHSIQEALVFACKLAGRKVGQQGLHQLSDHFTDSNIQAT